MATLIFCCGGECGFASSIAPHWVVNSGTPTFDTTTKRSGDRSIRCNVSASQASLRTVALSSSTRHVVRFYIRFATLPSADIALCFQGTSVNGPQLRFKQSDSKLYAAVGTTFGASGVSVTTGVWYRIDADFNINTSGSDTSDVRVDGTACGQATATGLSAAETAVSFGPGGASVTADVYFDDITISLTGADYPIGPGKVEHFVPTADGTHNIPGANQFERGTGGTDITNATTDAFQLADNVPLPTSAEAADSIQATAPANATDYVECVFGPAPGISAPTTGPRVIDVLVGHHQSATQSGNIRVAINDNGTTDDVLNLTAAGVTTIRYARKAYSDPPSAASVWNANNDGSNGDFRDLRFRFYSSDAAPDQNLDAIMIEAEFADTGYTLTAGAGTFSVTGNDASALQGRKLLPDAGSFAITGNDATARKGYGLLPDTGAFSVVGSDANIKRDYRPIADAGSFSYNGNNANALVGHLLTADAGVFAYVGNNANAVKGYLLSPAVGVFDYTGNAVNALRGYLALAAAGVFTINGNDANALRGWLLSAGSGAFAIVGNAAIAFVTGAGSHTLSPDSGVFSFTGNNANALRNYLLVADSGAFSYVGNAANALRNYLLTANAGVFAVTGNNANALLARLLISASGIFSYVGNDTHALRAYICTADGGVFVLTGADAFLLILAAFLFPNPPLSFEVNNGINPLDLNSGANKMLVVSGQNTAEISDGRNSLNILPGIQALDLNG